MSMVGGGAAGAALLVLLTLLPMKVGRLRNSRGRWRPGGLVRAQHEGAEVCRGAWGADGAGGGWRGQRGHAPSHKCTRLLKCCRWAYFCTKYYIFCSIWQLVVQIFRVLGLVCKGLSLTSDFGISLGWFRCLVWIPVFLWGDSGV